MGDEEELSYIRGEYHNIEVIHERNIEDDLETFLAENNNLIRLFKQVSNRLQNENYMIVIKADKVPTGENARRFNVPTVNEVGIVMIGDTFEQRDTRIMRRNNTTQVIVDTHQSITTH